MPRVEFDAIDYSKLFPLFELRSQITAQAQSQPSSVFSGLSF